MIRGVHPGTRIFIFSHPGSRAQGVKKAPDPDPQHCNKEYGTGIVGVTEHNGSETGTMRPQ
jgi:hypothetical protein